MKQCTQKWFLFRKRTTLLKGSICPLKKASSYFFKTRKINFSYPPSTTLFFVSTYLSIIFCLSPISIYLSISARFFKLTQLLPEC